MFNKEIIQHLSQLKTPFYYYDLDLLCKSLKRLRNAALKYGYHVHYAIKANANERILQIIRDFGFGADCVSGNEVKKAIETGFEKEKIVFAGVGKSDSEMSYALEQSIFSFNCESVEEIEIINQMAGEYKKIAPISLRLNPDIDALTHNYLTTGLNENKFGIPIHLLYEVIHKRKNFSNIKLLGLHFHIGSQITELEPYIALCEKINQIQAELLNKYGIVYEHLNLGGGLGINYPNPDSELIPDFEKFFETIHRYLKPLAGQEIHFEPGRSVVGQSGTLISKVLYVKQGVNKQFVILDAGMTDLIRPALYKAHHKIENLSKQYGNIPACNYDVVGPICESSDCFDTGVTLPKTERGDLFAIRSAGAYGEIMVSQYNLRNKPPVVYSDQFVNNEDSFKDSCVELTTNKNSI